MMKIIIKIMIAGLMVVGASHASNINVRMSPRVLLGLINARVDIQVRENISVGGIFDYSTYYIKYYAVGGGVNIKLDGQDIMKYDGWLVNPYYTYSYGKFENKSAIKDMSSNTVAIALAKQWIWKSGFNMRFGFGVQRNSIKYLGMTTFPFLTLNFGFVF